MTEESSDFEPVYLTLDHVVELYGLIIGATVKEAGDQPVQVRAALGRNGRQPAASNMAAVSVS